MSISLEPSAVRNSVITLPITNVRNICNFALLLCWMHVTDWSTSDPGAAGHCHCPVGRARNCIQCYIEKKKNKSHYFYTDLCVMKMPSLRQHAYCQSCQWMLPVQASQFFWYQHWLHLCPLVSDAFLVDPRIHPDLHATPQKETELFHIRWLSNQSHWLISSFLASFIPFVQKLWFHSVEMWQYSVIK